jgi:hypothetical protein
MYLAPTKRKGKLNFVKRHKILFGVLATPVVLYILLLLIIGPFAILSRIHNAITLRNFARPFLEYPLPPKTVEISNSADWGLLSGNGNHCDFKVSRTLSTELSQSEIEAYYKTVEFAAIVPERSSAAAIWGRHGMLGVDVNFDATQAGVVTISLFDGIYNGTIWDMACS